MSAVRAFQPRSIDPPHFVAENSDELAERVGEFLPGEQCDGCGNSSYRIDKHDSVPGKFVAVCATDPDEDSEFTHPDPCGTAYGINLWDEDEVVF